MCAIAAVADMDSKGASRDAQQYIVVPIYCTIYYIVQYNKIYCKAKKYCTFIYWKNIYNILASLIAV